MRSLILLICLSLLSACGTLSGPQPSSPGQFSHAFAPQSTVDVLASEPVQSAPPPGLVASLAAEFRWERHLEQPEVQNRINWYRENPEQLTQLLERSAPFLPLLAHEVRQRGLPAELAFLPLIESGYHPAIYSRSGAAGLWQLMPATARYLGLRIDWWYDERLNIQRSTEKALDYLEYLNKQFQGDWELAITAYNGGEGHVRARIRRTRSTNFWDLSLKRETEQYLPRLLAVAEILSNPEKYGANIPRIEQQSPLQSIQISEQIDLRLAAERAGVDYRTFKWLNPDFQRWISPPRGQYSILLPGDNIAALQSGIQGLKPDPNASWDHYRVQPGDTLGHIARRFGTSVSALRAVNELSSVRIYARQELLIPRRQTPAQGSPASQPDSMKELYIVKSGDSIWKIANRNNVSMSQLKRLNTLTERSILRPGQVLVLNEYFEGNETTYKVKQGDSLSVIAHQFNVAIADLRLWNALDSSDLIHPGQILKIRNI